MIAHRHKMSVSISTLPYCLWCTTCIVATTTVVTVPFLQLSTVVVPLMLLQMVNEVALVQPLGQQWPTLVTQGTLCKESTHVLAWPINVGVGEHLLAIVSCSQSDVTLYIHGHQKSISWVVEWVRFLLQNSFLVPHCVINCHPLFWHFKLNLVTMLAKNAFCLQLVLTSIWVGLPSDKNYFPGHIINS